MRKLLVASVTAAICILLVLAFQHPEILAGSDIRFVTDPFFGAHLVVRSKVGDVVAGLIFVLIVLTLTKTIRRRLADRKKGPQRLVRGRRSEEE